MISLAFCGELALRIASTFLRVGLDTTGTKSMAIEPDFTLRELAFVLVEATVVVFKSLENTTKVLVMLIFPFPNTMMSSEMFLHPGRPVRSSLIDS